MKQPKALRLADALETLSPLEREAAAQLRRLHEVNQELLEALKAVLEEGDFTDYPNTNQYRAFTKAKDIIAKATGGQQ